MSTLSTHLLTGRSMHPGVQIVRSLLASGVATAADYTTLLLLVRLGRLDAALAGSISMCAGLAAVYVLGRCWVFPAIPKGYRRIEFSLFAGVSALGALLHILILHMSLEYTPMHYTIAKAAAMGASFVWNFSLRRLITHEIVRRHTKNAVSVLDTASCSGC